MKKHWTSGHFEKKILVGCKKKLPKINNKKKTLAPSRPVLHVGLGS